MADWTKNITLEVYMRLCECRCTKEDIPVLVNAKWKFYKESGKTKYTKEDALVTILELLDANGQGYLLTEITKEEYERLWED